MKVLAKSIAPRTLLCFALVSPFGVGAQEAELYQNEVNLISSTGTFKSALSIRKKDLAQTLVPELIANSVVLSDRTLESSMPLLGESQVRLSLQARDSKKLSGKHPLIRLRDSLNLNYDFKDLDMKAQLNIRKRRFTVEYSENLRFEINDIGKESQFASVRYELKF
ncbi:hypothetical protein CL689_05040 [Candidatus Saccharibacteria bacterium]|nr:hypothetical protein [Candidatus Saccharibacteria bacterium]|tara:strand:+ start:1361 stop:1858 length:498 start_codon:yes stop_codon:yes gene_type:complete